MKKLLVLAFAMVLTSCYYSGETAKADKVDSNFSIQYIFTVDGVKVYRFWDGGSAHYLAIGDGTVADSMIGGKAKRSDSVIKATK